MERGSFPEGREGREGPAVEGPSADLSDRPAWEKTPGLPQQGAGNVCPACCSAEPSEGRLSHRRAGWDVSGVKCKGGSTATSGARTMQGGPAKLRGLGWPR